MYNFIIVVAATLLAIWQGGRNDAAACLVDIGIAVINMPFAIVWLTSLFD